MAAVDNARQQHRQRPPRGRRLDPAILAKRAGWLGDPPKPRERLIEALHVINDRLGHLPAPCVGRRESVPWALMHHHPVRHAMADKVRAAVAAGPHEDRVQGHVDCDAHRANGGDGIREFQRF